jgi:ubiquitin-conjugating enzyme E2 G1
MALKILHKELQQLLKEPNYYYSIEPDKYNFFIWNILLIGPSESIFEGGIFKCELTFTADYPNKAPKFRFITKFPHPNVYPDGKICISILNDGPVEPGFEYEDITERWNPSHSINSILMSILSLLINPTDISPANVDAFKMYRTNLPLYKSIIYKIIASNI